MKAAIKRKQDEFSRKISRKDPLYTKVFASASRDANQPLLARDLKKNTDRLLHARWEKRDLFLLLILAILHFNSLDLLAYIHASDKMCIIVVDFAELTTNSEDLEQFLRQKLI